jgi:transcriptional regulator with XRE-family HTH domain
VELKTNENTKNDYLLSIGIEIRSIRASQGFNQQEFARCVGLDKSYIGGVERGERNLSALNLIKIAKALQVPVSEFFKGIA